MNLRKCITCQIYISSFNYINLPPRYCGKCRHVNMINVHEYSKNKKN